MHDFVRQTEVRVSRGDVTACSDIAKLQEWHVSLSITAEEISAALKVDVECGQYNLRAADKLKFTRITLLQIKRRLAELGSVPIEGDQRVERLRADVTRLLAANSTLREENANLRERLASERGDQ